MAPKSTPKNCMKVAWALGAHPTLKQNEYLQVVWVKTAQTIINHEFWGGYEMPTPKFHSPSKKCVTVVKENARREKNIIFE